jgi:hypothetical protein
MKKGTSLMRGMTSAGALVVLAVGASAQQATPPATSSPPGTAQPVPPPAAPAKRSAADLQKLVEPIALYPDPLLATLLPASVYPLEIVQAARLMSDPKTATTLDQQPWDDSVKAIAKIPDALKKLNDDLNWTIRLGEAFLAQDKDVMDAIQALRFKAQNAGTLKSSDQMVVAVTNTVSQTLIGPQVVVVTNTIVQIESSDPEIIYVPNYNPAYVYYPPPSYVYDPYAPLVTFTAGVAMGAIIANNCDWHHGGCYHGDVDIDVDVDKNVNVNRESTKSQSRSSQKWQPDQSRLNKSGSASTASRQARGWDTITPAARPSTGTAATRPSTGVPGARPSTGTSVARPPTGSATARPATGGTASRPATTPGTTRPTTSQPSISRPSTTPSISKPTSSPSLNRPAPTSSQNISAFGGLNSGSSAQNHSARGSSSMGSSRSSGGGSRSGGGGRSGGGRGGRR